jgi:hypothetical protein
MMDDGGSVLSYLFYKIQITVYMGEYVREFGDIKTPTGRGRRRAEDALVSFIDPPTSNFLVRLFPNRISTYTLGLSLPDENRRFGFAHY